jgi:hypothetical protein
MKNTVKFQSSLMRKIKIILSIALLFPIVVYAHLISITATSPFPATVPATSRTIATFKVTNIAAKVSVSAINQSNFPSNSGLSIASSTCGGLLTPGKSCTIQVAFNAPAVGQTISSALKVWAKPSADGVQYPFNVTVTLGLPTITLVPVDSSQLPALRDPIVAIHNGVWLIVSGSLANMHDFNNNFNTDIYVYNPVTKQKYSVPISSTNLPTPIKNQLASSNPVFLQHGDTLYIIGGFYTPNNTTFTTLNTITAINVPGMIDAIINNQVNLAPLVTYNTSIPQFQVTGGQLETIGDDFYLAFGQNCEGNYCAVSQIYSNSIYQFRTDPTLSSITIVNSITHSDTDGSGWRRRDYTLAPFMLGNTELMLALGGPFTLPPTLIWTNAISFNANLQFNNHFITQQANQYLGASLSMHSANSNMSYVATFSTLSNLYWSTSGLQYKVVTPYGNILDLISSDAAGNVQEYANLQPMCSGRPLASCLYMGLAAEFIPVPNYYDSRFILQLDQLPQHTPTLVGYIYGGLVSLSQIILATDATSPSNQVYAVYLTPAGSGTLEWQRITNFFQG